LRESKKEQAEHASVVRQLRAALSGDGATVHAAEAPTILALDALQHLHTRVEALLPTRQTPTALALAGRVHPTPAVAGAPSDVARVWLRRHEPLTRGWYAGGIGWLAPGGDGALAVALRCALLRGGEARLYAGAGIVAGSTPDAELEETRLKLRAAMSALVEL
jgi:menaquinone-specific isochorismate synthase